MNSALRHGSGQLLALTGPPGANPDSLPLRSITPKTGAGVYRDACPTVSGALVAVYSAGTALDNNVGALASVVVRPTSAQEVADVLRVCNDARVPVTPARETA